MNMYIERGNGCCLTPKRATFQPYHDENMLHLYIGGDDARFVLYLHACMHFYSAISLKHIILIPSQQDFALAP